MSLPELVVFSVMRDSNDARYLSFTGPQRQLRFGPTEGIFSDTARFAIESARDGLVHIRSSYENNYWARSRSESWLVASAPEKVEDMSKDECTLFRPRLSTGNVFVEFIHAQSGLSVVMRPASDAHAYNLCVEHGAPTEFSFTDFATLSRTRLPRYVMFLGDNNKYLSTRKVNENSGFLHFSQYEAPTNREVGFEILYNKSGDNLRVKSMSVNEFSYVELPHMSVNVRPLPEFHPDTLFDAAVSSPPNTPEQGIALRALVNNQYCHRSESNQHALVAGSNSPHNRNAWLRPMYLGATRVNIESFRNAWTGPKSMRPLASGVFPNPETHEIEVNVPAQFTAHRTTTFRNSISLIKGHPTMFNGRMPDVGLTGELVFPQVAENVNASWGSSRMESWDTKISVKVKLPPRSLVYVTVYVNILNYEVPFSYKQIDVFPFGGTETQDLHDGVYILHSEGSIGVKEEAQPLTSEMLDQSIYKDIRVWELEGINALEDGIGSKASDEVNKEE